jgi:hypothetical protein
VDVNGDGFSLEEAFRRSLTQAELAELDKYEQYREHPLAWIPGEPPSEDQIGHRKYVQIREPLQERFMQKLRSGQLVATALELPLKLESRRTPIPAALWRVLEPDFQKSEASGAGLKLITIEVSATAELQAIVLAAGSDSHQPPPDRSASQGHLHLSEDNRILILGSKQMYFRGTTQQLILRQLFDAYKTGQRLRTEKVLRKANSSADSIAKAFTGNRHWATLDRVIQRENGYCWFQI